MNSEQDTTIVIEPSSVRNSHSPLWIVSQEPLLNELVSYLAQVKEVLEANPSASCELTFSRAHIRECRAAFDRMIRKGEEDLHRLCQLLCEQLLGSTKIESFVVGELAETGKRFSLAQRIQPEDLYSTSDLDLGTRQLQKIKYFENGVWVTPSLVANMVEYQPVEANEYAIFKMISRIKAEEELWNKVVDEIFNLDALVKRDKEVRHLSRYVKDVFGIKLVVGSVADMRSLQERIASLEWTAGDLTQQSATNGNASSDRLHFLEVKDYLDGSGKQSGWQAIKSVVTWRSGVFEIQVQPLMNFWKEREFLMRESHAGFKARRELVRMHIAEQVPLFGFYNQLLKWMFQDMQGELPSFQGISVSCVE